MGFIRWLQEHWRATLGAATLIDPVWRVGRWVITILGDLDFLVSRINDPGWLGTVINFIVNLYGALAPILALAGLGLIYWDIRRHRKQGATTHSTPATNVFFPPTVTQHDPPPFKGENLYTGLIIVSAGQLEERRAIEIAMRCFNGSGNAIFIQRVEGTITVNEMAGSSSKPIGDLPLPWLSDKAKQREIQPSEEFLVLLEQRVTEEIAGKIASIGPGLAIGFDFDGLNILVGSHFRPEILQRLPLWNGVRLSRSAELFHSGRIISMRMKAGEYKITPSST